MSTLYLNTQAPFALKGDIPPSIHPQSIGIIKPRPASTLRDNILPPSHPRNIGTVKFRSVYTLKGDIFHPIPPETGKEEL